MSRTIVIGDLHGCLDEALDLLDAVGLDAGDLVVFTGDLVDRGPYPRECVELAMQHQCVLGNHEERLLQSLGRHPDSLSPDHRRTRLALGEEHLEYLQGLPHLFRLPEHEAAVVHAGAYPGVPLEQQEPYHLLHLQHCLPPRRRSYWPSKAPADARFWTHFWEGPERLLFGHTVLDQPLLTEWAVGLDTGACFGGPLTALVLPAWELVSVPARKEYVPPRGAVASYPVHGEVRAFS